MTPGGVGRWSVLVAGLAVVLVVTAPTGAQAAEDSPTPTPSETSTDTGGVCGVAPGLAGDLCHGIGDAVGGGIGAVVGGGTEAALRSTVGFVVDGAAWLLEQLTTFIDTSTRPDLQSGWFRAAYRDMAVIGMLGVLPFLLLALVQALLRQDVALMLRVVFGYVPVAAVGTSAAVVVVDLLVQLTDQMSAWIGRGLGEDLSAFATGMGTALARITAPGSAVAGLAALVGGAVVAFAAFVIWLELLLRQGAIYVAVLFFPLGFMAMVWPATAHWLRRLVEGLVAIILSKFVIVAVMALAASALDADVADEGFGVVVAGGSLLALAALAPYVLLRLIPVFDAGMSSQLEGTFRRPTAAVGRPVTGSQVVGMMRHRVAGASASGASGAAGGAGAARAAGGAAGAGAAGLTTVAAGAAGARAAANGTRARAEQVTDVAAAPAAGPSGASTAAGASGSPPAAPTRRESGSEEGR